ncbi:MAG: NADH-quinone oxidoreductase subunit K [Candidatus Lindowbacteria bacterium RIFCSPLOWO2_12_FULL_62_27]|nr:MAG: NADH-quinone oxidoreductase subunit K [Candidatus Lindowbacteria bacterium RIFCSPLOWO2_12_FULL_62_27]OGH64020.1 MAG: NADH-quinone oxidoreductase subunit K [Candidatus Lindowbacteria bacterium RIFCSPLOWO2_02_FULL_62_12]
MITLQEYLSVGALLFTVGLLIVLFRQNAISILMGIELMLNAANINFVAFSNALGGLTGQVLAIFVVVAAAAEAAVAIAIIVLLYQNLGTVDVEKARNLNG